MLALRIAALAASMVVSAMASGPYSPPRPNPPKKSKDKSGMDKEKSKPKPKDANATMEKKG